MKETRFKISDELKLRLNEMKEIIGADPTNLDPIKPLSASACDPGCKAVCINYCWEGYCLR